LRGNLFCFGGLSLPGDGVDATARRRDTVDAIDRGDGFVSLLDVVAATPSGLLVVTKSHTQVGSFSKGFLAISRHHKTATLDRRGAPSTQISGLGARSRARPKAPNAKLLGDTRVARTPPRKSRKKPAF